MISSKANKETEDWEEESTCWRAIPIQYDNYSKELSDKYHGEVFGHMETFESPHYLYRRFHRNYCKAYAFSSLKDYSIENNDKNPLIDELSDHTLAGLNLRILSFHHSLTFLVSSLEAFLKDNFTECLKINPSKLGNDCLEKKIKKFNFQNVDSINRAFNWLFENDIVFVTDDIKKPIERRHKIVHESHYYETFSKDELDDYFVKFLIVVQTFHHYMEDYGYYKLINFRQDENIDK